MPSKNTIKRFASESMYHVYNRGVEKRNIFLDERDYAVFLCYLKIALSPRDQDFQFDSNDISAAQRFNLRRLELGKEVELVAFCLMPNHFHLLLYQYSDDGITKLMRSIGTGYSMYFNKRYKRVGPLFQSRYKASPINNDKYWLHISRYIHLNPLDLGEEYDDFPYSSYRWYFDQNPPPWLKPKKITNSFSNKEEYEKFIEDYLPSRNELLDVKHMLANM